MSPRLLYWSGAILIALVGNACSKTLTASGNGQGGTTSSGGASGGSSGGGGGGGGSQGSGGSSNSGGSTSSSASGGAGGSSSTSGSGGSTVQCTGSQTACSSTCVDLQTDAKNCGKCATVCASGVCNAGVCRKVKDCYTKVTITSPLVADFEGYDGTTAVASWGWAFNAAAGSSNAVYAGLYEYDDGTGTTTLAISKPGNNSSKYAAEFSDTQSTKWSGGLGMWMGCVDASAYQGLSFWVKGTAPTGTATLNLASEATSAPDSTGYGGGTCTSGTCANATVNFPVTSSWSQVLVKWSAFTPGTANGSTVTTTGADITGLSWNVGLKYTAAAGDAGYTAVAAAYDIEVDDVQFMGTSACSTGLSLCGTSCVDATTDNNNCGTCGTVCATPRTCSSGKCACPSGYTDCSGVCVDTTIDAQNCGGCGNAYACTGVCSNSACTTSTCTANMTKQNQTSTSGASITLGKYWINNNEWGASNGTGSQSIWSTCSSGNTIGWGTSWTWSGGTSVKSFASAVLGWQWGWKIANTGLPVQFSSSSSLNCAWTYTVNSGSGTMNVAYDLYAHTSSNPGASTNPNYEIMIWLYTNGAAPIGSQVATISNIAGTSWNVYKGYNGNWDVYSYVRSGNASTGATLNLMDFIHDLTGNRGLSSSLYLTSVQAGTEVTTGTNGELDTSQYYCVIQ